MMIFGHREVARVLGVLGAFGELILSLAGTRVGTIVRRGLLPVVDLRLQRSFGRLISRQSEAELGLIGTVVRRMLLAWKKKAQRLEDSTFLLMDSVWAPFPSVSDNARQSAMMAIRSATFLFSPDA
jgi:hypothetical protein